MPIRPLARIEAQFSVLALLLTALPALAQTSGAARLPQDTRVEPQPAPNSVRLQIPKDSGAGDMPADAGKVSLRLTGIDLEGHRALSTAQLQPVWAGKVGQVISLREVFDIAAEITSAYRNAGYVLSQAIVPQQDIDPVKGRVRIRVLEGHIGKLTVSGLDSDAQTHLHEVLAPVVDEKPVTLATLERRLLQLNDLPGVSAQASLAPSSTPGAADVEVAVARQPQSFGLSLTNRTSRALGSIRAEAWGEQRGLFGHFDRHNLRLASSGDDRLALLAYSGDVPLNADGLQLGWSASASRSKPKTGASFALDTNASNAGLSLSYPVLRSREANVSVRGAFSAYNGDSSLGSTLLPLSRDRLRVLRAGVSADRVDPQGGVNLVDLEVSKGLSGLGASQRGDVEMQRAEANPQFTKVTLYAARLQSLPEGWSLLAAVNGQYSADPLGSSEQFALGGDTFLRAYDPAELLGDTGAAIKLELRRNAAFGAVNATVYGYGEAGSVTLNSAAGNSTQSAQSLGLGLRMTLAQGLKGFVEAAKPVSRSLNATGTTQARVFAGIAYER